MICNMCGFDDPTATEIGHVRLCQGCRDDIAVRNTKPTEARHCPSCNRLMNPLYPAYKLMCNECWGASADTIHDAMDEHASKWPEGVRVQPAGLKAPGDRNGLLYQRDHHGHMIRVTSKWNDHTGQWECALTIGLHFKQGNAHPDYREWTSNIMFDTFNAAMVRGQLICHGATKGAVND